jgi:hypothetical protein
LRPFLDQFRPPIGEEEFVEKIWETALRYAENIIVAPIHWNNVPNNVQRSIMNFHSANGLLWREAALRDISLFEWARRAST